MTIKLVRREGALEAILEGMLDTTTAPGAETALLQAADRCNNLRLNFSQLRYITSAGLRVLLKVQKRMAVKGGGLELTGVSKQIGEIFEITGFSEILRTV